VAFPRNSNPKFQEFQPEMSCAPGLWVAPSRFHMRLPSGKDCTLEWFRNCTAFSTACFCTTTSPLPPCCCCCCHLHPSCHLQTSLLLPLFLLLQLLGEPPGVFAGWYSTALGSQLSQTTPLTVLLFAPYPQPCRASDKEQIKSLVECPINVHKNTVKTHEFGGGCIFI